MIISNKNLELLKFFSDWANKGGIGFHPCDRERWYKFIISSYRDEEILAPDYLRELLNNMGWKEHQDKVFSLSSKYEEAIDILRANERY